MESEIVKEKHSLTSSLLKSWETLRNNLMTLGVIFLITQSVENKQDIMLIKQGMESYRSQLVYLQEETEKVRGNTYAIQTIQKDVDKLEMRVGKIEDHLSIIK